MLSQFIIATNRNAAHNKHQRPLLYSIPPNKAPKMKKFTSSNDYNSPPAHFLCALTMKVMEDPVRNKRTGQNFDRQAITDWIEFFGGATCPLTGQPLDPAEGLVKNERLAEEILIWQQLARAQEKMASLCKSSTKISIKDQYMSLYGQGQVVSTRTYRPPTALPSIPDELFDF